jgi:hypothetical protein
MRSCQSYVAFLQKASNMQLAIFNHQTINCQTINCQTIKPSNHQLSTIKPSICQTINCQTINCQLSTVKHATLYIQQHDIYS